MTFFLILIAVGLALSLFVAHATFWLVDRARSEREEPRDNRFERDAHYARVLRARRVAV